MDNEFVCFIERIRVGGEIKKNTERGGMKRQKHTHRDKGGKDV